MRRSDRRQLVKILLDRRMRHDRRAGRHALSQELRQIEGRRFAFRGGQSIHTENSHKYGPRGARLLLLAGGWTPLAEWMDAGEDFALILAEAQRERFAP